MGIHHKKHKRTKNTKNEEKVSFVSFVVNPHPESKESHMSKTSRFFLTLLVIIALAPLAATQTSRGTITGSVLDRTGAAVPRAKVTARNNATSITIETEATGDGTYRLQQLPAG